ncbi:MAG TPA: serine/threonine-protein kinase [Steroidobacteraceae bacterium]|nr:serine/threonine-protein kinase [Steroidobacteraceae bacterium]
MNVERERLALEYLEESLGWQREEREWRLRVMLDKDPEMLSEVRALLAAADAANQSMPTKMAIEAVAEDAPPPERIGPYRLGPLLGRGGMGRVYRADRVDGVFEQTIAIKLMRRSRMPALLAAQFARERQILARFQHRNIAQLYDGGVTPDGLSYFVMELVTGRPITQYAREEQLPLRKTLLLFMQVCSAVQYAHSRLVVHADIKPSNIIVTADGTAKLLDFGVARVIEESGGEPASGSNTLGLTYDYASPARQRGDAPTTVDDVYSLGVLLGELLQPLGKLAPDLCSIWLRAQAADVTARYDSVSELQADVERWLDGLPVVAHGKSWRYLARRFISRHRFGVALGGAACLLLIGASIGLAGMYVHAEQAKRQAEQRFSDLRALSRYVLFDVYDRLEATPRALTLRRDIAAAGQRYLDRLAQDPHAPAEVRIDVIEGLRRLAQVQGTPGAASLAQVPLARANLDRAEQLVRALPQDLASARTRSLLLARIALARSIIASEQDLDFNSARATLAQAQDLTRELLARDPLDPEASGLWLDIAVQDAGTLEWQGRYAQAIEVARAALARPTLTATSQDVRRAEGLRRARLLDILGEGVYYGGDPTGAVAPYREEYELLRSLAAAEPLNVMIGRRLVRAGWGLGSTLVDIGRAEEGERILAEARALGERLEDLEPEDRDLARLVEITASAHAQGLVALRRFGEAGPLLERILRDREQRAREAPQDWQRTRDYALAQQALADMWADAGDGDRACATYQASLATFGKIHAAGKATQLDEDYSLPNIYARMRGMCPGIAAR